MTPEPNPPNVMSEAGARHDKNIKAVNAMIQTILTPPAVEKAALEKIRLAESFNQPTQKPKLLYLIGTLLCGVQSRRLRRREGRRKRRTWRNRTNRCRTDCGAPRKPWPTLRPTSDWNCGTTTRTQLLKPRTKSNGSHPRCGIRSVLKRHLMK